MPRLFTPANMYKNKYHTNKSKYLALMSPQRPLNEKQKIQVKRIVQRRSELKYHSKDIQNNIGLLANNLLIDITDVSQGLTDTSRVGDKLMLARVEYLFSFLPTAGTNYVVRVMFFQYKPNDAALLSSIAPIVDTGPTGVIDPWSPYDFDFHSDYTILSDKLYTSNSNGQQVVTQQKRNLPIKKIKHEITYNAGGTTGGNHIYMWVISNVAVATPIVMNGRVRIFFRDS